MARKSIGRTAAAAYEARSLEVKTLLDKIGDLVQIHNGQAAKRPEDWGFAGDLEHVAELLGQARRFLANEEE